MVDTKEALKRNFLKPAICAGVGGALGVHQQLGAWTLTARLPVIGGTTLSSFQYGAVVGALSCFVVESLNNIFLSIPQDQRLKNAESFVMHSFGSMATWVLIPSLLGQGGGLPDQQQAYKLAGIGLLSEMVSQWIHENFIDEGSFGQDVLDYI